MPVHTKWTGAESPLMAQDPRLFFEETLGSRLLHRVAEALPEDVVLGFQITGPGGGNWQVSTAAGGTRVEPLQAGPRDCTVRCTADVFMDIVRGGLDAREAFLDGRLRLVGDIGLALRVQGVLPSAA